MCGVILHIQGTSDRMMSTSTGKLTAKKRKHMTLERKITNFSPLLTCSSGKRSPFWLLIFLNRSPPSQQSITIYKQPFSAEKQTTEINITPVECLVDALPHHYHHQQVAAFPHVLSQAISSCSYSLSFNSKIVASSITQVPAACQTQCAKMNPLTFAGQISLS